MKILIRKIALAYFLIDNPLPHQIEAVRRGDGGEVADEDGRDVMDGEYHHDAILVEDDVAEATDELDRLTAFAAFQRDMVRDNGHFELATALLRLDNFEAKSSKENFVSRSEALEVINATRETLRKYVFGP